MIIACIMDLIRRPIAGSMYKLVKTSISRYPKIYPESYNIIIDKNTKLGTIRFSPLPENHTQFVFEIPLNIDSPLGHFLKDIFNELHRLGFAHFEKEKPPLGFKPPTKESHLDL